jgi:predicted MFS family arabinose efflux permease
VGAFGASVTLGIALALAVGGGLADAGVSWRAGFWVAAAAGASALPVLPGSLPRPDGAAALSASFLRRASATGEMWRLMLLFINSNGITIVVSTWLIPYLARSGHVRPAVAGALGFALFAVTAAVRQVSGRLAESAPARLVMIAGGPALAAAGLAGLAVEPSTGASVAWVALMGAGFALPYTWMLVRAQRMFPDAPAATIALLQTGPNIAPMAIIPLVGSALDAGNGEVALLALAGFVGLAAVANARV